MALPDSLMSLCGLVFLLGVKHGFDADHLATIDGMTRFNTTNKPQLAKYCGALFSLGHGAIVISISLMVSLFASQWEPPAWLNVVGAFTSFSILLLLGVMNLYTVLSSHPAEIVRMVGVRSKLLGSRLTISNPTSIAMIGALFALSFDTISQAVFFSLAATYLGGWNNALLLGVVFTVGMLVTDGVNGYWISHMLYKADNTARFMSRIMTLLIGGISITIAAVIAVEWLLPDFAEWNEGKKLYFSLLLLLLIAAGYFIPMKLHKR
ncbi:MAG: nickel transporter [Fluviibacter sp.]